MGKHTLMWLIMSLVVCTAAAATQLTCEPPLCTGQNYNKDANSYYFDVGEADKRHKMYITYKDSAYISLNCGEQEMPRPPAMPYFTSPVHVSEIELYSCFPPASGSYAEVLSAMNVTLQKDEDDKSSLQIKSLSQDQTLLPKYFAGLEHLTNLFMSASPEMHAIPAAGFLSGLENLRDISLAGIPLHDRELNNLPKLRAVTITGTVVKSLQEILLTMPSYWRYLTLRYNEVEIDNDVPKDAKVDSSELENLWLIKWEEKRLVPMERCNNLRMLELVNPSVEVLPERWVAACPQLETLIMYSAENLTSLPQKLFEGATGLKYLTLSNGELQSLPERLFEGAPNLIKINLSGNSIQTISSSAFSGLPSLNILRLESNHLENKALESLKSLTSLTELGIANNYRLHNLCDHNGYSPFKDLIQLRELSLQGLNVTHICRDWRENLIHLPQLSLQGSQISELGFNDLQFKRDAAIKTVLVSLTNVPLTSIRFTEDDYKKATSSPGTGPVVKLDLSDTNIVCDCNMYWTWVTVKHMAPKLIEGIICDGKTPLVDQVLACPQKS